MNENHETPAPVPYVVYEAALAHAREDKTRWFWATILALFLLAATNLYWLHCWMQYDYVSDTYTQDGEGINMICGGDGYYGAEVQAEEAYP